MKVSQAPMTWGVLIAIFIMFLIEIASGVPATQSGFTQVDVGKLIDLGANVPDSIQRGEYWRFVTAMFIHIGLLHLLVNSWALYQLGAVFEIMFGSVRFLVTYFVTGIVASIVSVLYTAETSAGASGAIFGILGALIVAIRRSSKWRNQPWTRGLTHQLIFWAAINIFIVSRIPGVDNAAHIGGLVSGLILGLYPHHEPPPPPSQLVIDANRDGGTGHRVE